MTGILNLDDSGACRLEITAKSLEQFADRAETLIGLIAAVFQHGNRITITRLRIV